MLKCGPFMARLAGLLALACLATGCIPPPYAVIQPPVEPLGDF